MKLTGFYLYHPILSYSAEESNTHLNWFHPSKFWLLTKACHEKHFEDLSPSHRHRTWLDLTLKIRSMTSKYELVSESLTFKTVYDNSIWSSKKAPHQKTVFEGLAHFSKLQSHTNKTLHFHIVSFHLKPLKMS